MYIGLTEISYTLSGIPYVICFAWARSVTPKAYRVSCARRLKEFGKRYYENTAYFNFDENEEYRQFFETTKNVNRIFQNLMLASGQKIQPEKTLIIFDEVQDCPKVINFMKYFCENAPQYHVACACSLLGIALAQDVNAMQEALSNIIGAYERDFAKYPNINEFPKISMIWKSIPSQLARENKKFIYKVVKEGARAREYDDLSAFKIYLVDVGLLRRLAMLALTAFGEGNRLFTEFKGALTENYALQTLITQFEVTPRYWSQNNPPYKVDG